MYTIYVHTFPNGKKYVGATRNKLCKRFGKDGNNYNTQELKKAIKQYGWSNIKHEIIEQGLSYELAKERERFWIKELKTTNPEFGYNKMSGGQIPQENKKRPYIITENREKWYRSMIGHKVDEETRIKIKNSRLKNRNIKVEQYDGENLIKVWKSTGDIYRELGYDRQFLCRTCRYNSKNTKKRSAYGYIWEYKKETCF